jgi:hypothetical protein
MFVRRLYLLSALLLVAGAIGQPAPAQNFTVNSTTDNADSKVGDGVCCTGVALVNPPGTMECTLRAAIQEASGLAGAHVITVPTGTYTLTDSTPCPASSGGVHLHYCISGNVSIVGAGASTTILDAGHADRVIFISPNATAQISGVTIQNGHQSGGTYDGGGGGGIMNQGTRTVLDSVFRQNVSDAFGGGINSIGPLTVKRTSFLNNSGGQTGGGLYQEGSQSTIEDCIFMGNAAGNGGGLSNLSSTMNVTGSLFFGNTASSEGGGVFGYQFNDPKHLHMVITNSTITGNQSPVGGGAAFGNSIIKLINNSTIVENSPDGLYNGDEFEPLTMQNTIVANNPTLNGADCDGLPITSKGHNLIGNPAHCALNGDTATNITGQDPQLGRGRR